MHIPSGNGQSHGISTGMDTDRQGDRQEASVCRQIDGDWEGERHVVSNAGMQEGRRADG